MVIVVKTFRLYGAQHGTERGIETRVRNEVNGYERALTISHAC